MLATRTFSLADQRLFARASGDFNPMHMDPLAARRTPAGAPVVHGMHVFLWALESLLQACRPPTRLAAMKATFKSFVYLDRPVELELVTRDERHMKARVHADGMPVVNLTLQLGGMTESAHEVAQAAPELRLPSTPEDHDFESTAGLSGWLALGDAPAELAHALPNAIVSIGSQRVAALARLSAIVGMVCPGLHSIFSEFSLKLMHDEPARRAIGFRTLHADERFRLVTMAIGGAGFAGEARCFVRRAPVAPPEANAFASLVLHDEFAKTVALIVGGSRGLGAVTANLIAAGGGKVVITYANGREDALGLQRDIEAEHGAGTCRAIALDVQREVAPQLRGATLPEIDQLYYFATPHIYRPHAALVDPSLFEEFVRYYVFGFCETVRAIGAHSAGRPLAILYPSSVFVERAPKHLTEYAMAKSAGEQLCKALALAEPRLHVVCERLPAMRTDQTAGVLPVEDAQPAPIMLRLIRSMRKPTP